MGRARVGLEWVGLEWVGLEWVGLEWVGPCCGMVHGNLVKVVHANLVLGKELFLVV